jgi:hypothetical protein
MKRPVVPYSLPRNIEPKLQRVLAYWKGLKRAGNSMPFWDDVNLSSIPDLTDSLMLIGVYEDPIRFRFRIVGKKIADRYGAATSPKFLDELDVKSPFEYLLSQCSATIEKSLPTFYQHLPSKSEKSHGAKSYSRVLLPLWGNGHIGMLLGAVLFRSART